MPLEITIAGFSPRQNSSLVLGTATVNLVHIALAIELTISIVEVVFKLLTPWVLWQPWPGLRSRVCQLTHAQCRLRSVMRAQEQSRVASATILN